MLSNLSVILMTSDKIHLFTALDNAIHSASELNDIRLFCALDLQETITPKTVKINQVMLLFVSGLPALSLSLNHNRSHGSFQSLSGLIFVTRFFMSHSYLITEYIYKNAAWLTPSINLDNDLTAVVASNLECL